MKYLFISFFFLGIVSCGSSTPSDENSGANTIPTVNVEGVEISSSGVSVGLQSGNISENSGRNTLINNASGNLSIGNSGTTISSDNTHSAVGDTDVSVKTSIKTPPYDTANMEKDPEVQAITDDIDSIFSDIEKGGQ